ncbi:MAG TPA: TonB-dependent receptor plug domain-containing protein, partial [Gemmatimonadaceae bacterium]|nr:TonB-dependent receptor plug domain-containing protein [Gemmatimonadaceae bacterium]
MRVFLFAATVIIAPVISAGAQQACSSSSALLASAPSWSPPLDRRVSLHVRDVSLRESLDRLAAGARVRLSYTTESLPLDARVCASFDSISLGDALGVLLRGMPVLPTAAGGEHVVLSPQSPENDDRPRAPRILDRIVVTGSAIEAPARRLTVAMNVVSGAQLARYPEGNLGQALNAAVPGVWLWQSAPTSLLAHYGSIRGTSSFGASYPKIYVDGIELANPLLVTQFTPETVERIEIIRGPQGAALYGTDAISGVINIVTRHDGSSGAPSTVARTAVGAAASSYVQRAAITQDHAVTVREGASAQSVTASFTSGAVGAYLPGAYARHTTGSAGLRVVRSKFIATATGRLFDSRSADPSSPLFRDSVSATRLGLTNPQSVREYTLGGNALITQSEHWTHAIVAGFDGSRISNIRDYNSPLPSATGADIGTAGGNANLASLRVSSVAKIDNSEDVSTTLTFSAENSLLDFKPAADTASNRIGGSATAIRRVTSAGLAQANLSWNEAGYVTAGLRVERNNALGASTISVLPMLGAAILQDYGSVTVKLRSAYGRGIRPATMPARETGWFDPRSQHVVTLAPEEQSGIEAGLDLFVGRTIGIQLTRFDQRASGLIQRVAYAVESRGPSPGGGGSGPPSGSPQINPEDRRIEYVLQNVGEITNRG